MRRKTPATPSNPSGCLIGPQHCLDEEFDAADDDRELLLAIVAGRIGLHPDAFSHNNDCLSLQPWRWRKDDHKRLLPVLDHYPPSDPVDRRHELIWPRPEYGLTA